MEGSSQCVKAIIEFLRDMKNLIGWKVTCFRSQDNWMNYQNKLFSLLIQVVSAVKLIRFRCLQVLSDDKGDLTQICH